MVRREFLCVVPALLSGVAARAQNAAVGAEKEPLIAAYTEIEQRAQRIRNLSGDSTLGSAADAVARSARWFVNNGAKWSPKQPGEGRPLLESAQRMLQALREAPNGRAELEPLLLGIQDDLAIKEAQCRRGGLAVKQTVTVVTRRNGLQEIQGLAVLYLEKFLAGLPNAAPKEFLKSSSPTQTVLVPGRYVIWSRENDGAKRSGPRKEVLIDNALPPTPIEVLTP